MKVLWFKAVKTDEWFRVESPSGTYGRHGSLENYQKWLEEERGRETKITEEPATDKPFRRADDAW